MPFIRPGEMAVIISTINLCVYIGILDNFLIPWRENWFDNEIVFQDDNAPCHRAKGIKAFLQEKSMTHPEL